MGILQRISKVLESNLNALLDKAEDPSKVLDQAIEDMKKGMGETRDAIIEAKTEQKLTEKRRDQARAEAAELEKKAMRALEGGDESLARKLVEAKIRADERFEAESRAIAEHDKHIGQLDAATKELDRRLKDMPAKRAALLARKSAAEARGARVGAQSKAVAQVGGAMQAFDRMEEKIIRAEVEADVRGELEPGSNWVDTRALDNLAADDALAQLKAKMAAKALPSGMKDPEPKPAAAAPEPAEKIDDTLASLKAKLRNS